MVTTDDLINAISDAEIRADLEREILRLTTALASAEAEHAERVKVLVDTLESIPYYAYGDNEAAVKIMDTVREFTEKYQKHE